MRAALVDASSRDRIFFFASLQCARMLSAKRSPLFFSCTSSKMGINTGGEQVDETGFRESFDTGKMIIQRGEKAS